MTNFYLLIYKKGKTCLVRRFCQGVFPVGQAATIGVDFLIKTLDLNGDKIKVNIVCLLFFIKLGW